MSYHPYESYSQPEVDWLDEMRWNQEWYVQEYFDVNGKALCPKLTEKAMLEEVDYMMGLPVWTGIQSSELLPGDKVIPTKWVLVQKVPVVRARLAACEVKYSPAGGTNADLVAATPST